MESSTYRDYWFAMRQKLQITKDDMRDMVQRKSQIQKVRGTQSRPPISVCDVMRDNTNAVIKKVEGLLPSHIQGYADFYTEYLHFIQDLFGACYISERELLDKMGIDQKALENFDVIMKIITSATISQIDIASNFQKAYASNALTALKSCDEYVHLMLDSYAKSIANAVNLFKKS